MKTRLLKLIHYISIVLVVFIAMLIFSLALLRALAPLVASEVPRTEIIASNYLKQPVSIESLSLRWHGFVPVIDAKNVILWDGTHTTKQLTIGEVEAGLDFVDSLFSRHLVLSSLTLKNLHLTLKQQQNNQWQIQELSSLASTNITQGEWNNNTILEKLKPWHRIDLKHVAIDAYPINGEHWQLQINEGRWHEQFFNSRKLTLDLQLNKPTASKLNVVITSKGSWNDIDNWQSEISARLVNVNLTPFSRYLAFKDYQVQQGLINGFIHVHWQAGEWSNIFIQTVLDHWVINLVNEKENFFLDTAALDVRGYWSSHKDWEISGDIPSITWQRFNALPGVDNLSGKLVVTPTQGKFLLNSGDTTFDFGPLFAAQETMQQLQGEIAWQQKQQGWEVNINKLIAKNEDLSAAGSADLIFRPQQSPWLNLTVFYHLYPSAVNHLNNYLPVMVLNPALIQWLTHSIKEVKEGEGKFVLKGYAKDFPYANAPGEFLVDSYLKGVTLDYAAGWPEAKNINTQLTFSDNLMVAKVASAELASVPIKNIDVAIPELGQQAQLEIHGVVNADAKDLQHFVNTSPLQNTVGRRLSGLEWHGPANLTLQLQIPIGEQATPAVTQVLGNLILTQNQLQIPSWKIALQNFQGQVQFTQDKITSDNLQATLFDKPITLTINTPQITFNGQISFSELPLSFAQQLKPYLAGKTNFQGVIQLAQNPNQQDQITLTTNLQGASVSLPTPYGKTTTSNKNLRLDIFTGAKQALRYIINYNNLQLSIINHGNGSEIDINHPQIAGQLNWPNNAMQQGVTGQFSFLAMQSNSQKTSTLVNPNNIPPLNIIVKDMRYNNKQFGSVNLQTLHTQNGLIINQLQTHASSYQTNVNGQWAQNFTQIQGTLQSNNVGAMLQSWQLPASIQSKNAQINFKMQWPGAAYSPNFPFLQGILHFDVSKGRLVNVGSQAKMDIGRLLTVLSFQSIAQRLQLDFSDFTQSGLEFQKFTGDFQIVNGIASTSNTSMDGSVADIDMKGMIDLVNETYNLQLRVTPHLTSSLPLIATIAGGPVAGAVTWAASKIVNPVLNKITSDNYSVTGSWNNPVIKSI